jgi:hypothetical protein
MSSRRAPTGFTFDPCHGCGLIHDYQPRPKSGVCVSCREVLNAHSKAVSEASLQGLVAVGVPEQPHWLPYIHNDTQNVQKLFHAVSMAVSVPSSGGVDYLDETHRLVLVPKGNSGSGWSPYNINDFRVMSAPIALTLRSLYDGLLHAMPAAYKEGKADGCNLLAMLCAGELTNSEFERRAGIVPVR